MATVLCRITIPQSLDPYLPRLQPQVPVQSSLATIHNLLSVSALVTINCVFTEATGQALVLWRLRRKFLLHISLWMNDSLTVNDLPQDPLQSISEHRIHQSTYALKTQEHCLHQQFSTFLMLRPFSTTPRVVVTLDHEILFTATS